MIHFLHAIGGTVLMVAFICAPLWLATRREEIRKAKAAHPANRGIPSGDRGAA